jgi:hypothetical protein
MQIIRMVVVQAATLPVYGWLERKMSRPRLAGAADSW